MALTLSEQASALLHLLQLLGTVALALSAAMAAKRPGADVFGVAAVGLVVAVSGASLRDVLMGEAPVFWVVGPHYAVVAALAAFAGALLARVRMVRRWQLFRWTDAVALATLSIAGTDVCLARQATPLVAVILGSLTGLTGSLLRDALLNRTLLLLKEEFYVTATLLGTALHVFFVHTPLGGAYTSWLSIVVILALRISAVRGWARLSRH